MTNETIIFNERLTLMDAGIIGTTGRKIQLEDASGNTTEIEEPEPIHTYLGWRERNRQVKRGERSIDSFQIWKYTIRKAKDDTEEDQEKMFLTKAYFFKESQTEEIKNS